MMKPMMPMVSCCWAFLVASGLPGLVIMEKPEKMMIKNRMMPARVKM